MSVDGYIFRLQDSDAFCDYDPNPSGESLSCSSDAKLKKDITEAPSLTSWLTSIPIKEYTVIASGDRYVGVIAQELRDVHPDMVREVEEPIFETIINEEGEEVETQIGTDVTLAVEQPNLWKLVKVIQEQQEMIEELEERVEELE